MNRFVQVIGIWDARDEVKDMMSVIVCGCCIEEKHVESVSSVGNTMILPVLTDNLQVLTDNLHYFISD